MSSVDDPEKHFLGNLLEDDPSSSSTSTQPKFSERNGTTMPTSITQMTTVGPVMCPKSDHTIPNAWPEPPPPYSPRLESWGVPSNANTVFMNSPTLPATNWFSFQDRKDATASELFNTFDICGNPTPVSPSTSVRASHSSSSQIHHFHHNLHHHTHTHNVQVQNHYFGSPPPGLEAYGLPRTTTSVSPPTSQLYESITKPSWNYTGLSNINTKSNNVLFSDWKKENMSHPSPDSTAVSECSASSVSVRKESFENGNAYSPLSASEVVEIARVKTNVSKSYAEHLSKSNAATTKKGTPIGAEKKQKQELAKKISSQLSTEHTASRIIVKGQPHSAPVVTRMPFSYRDVAARQESTSAQINGNQQSEEGHKKDSSLMDLKSSYIKAIQKKNSDCSGKTSKTSEKIDHSKKSHSELEFQKINNRKKEKNSNSVAAPIIYEGVHPVDASSRYEVLKNLESPAQNSIEKKNPTGRPPLIQKIFSRSSSPSDDMADTEEEETHRTRSTSNNVHQNGNGQLKKDQRKRVVQVNQRRRKGRKEEPTWLQNAWCTFSGLFWLVCENVAFGLQWTLLLIVEVCQKIADIFVIFGSNMWTGTCKALRNILLTFIFICFFIIIAFKTVLLRSLNFIKMIGQEESKEVEELDWGCKKELPIPASASEFVDRLSRETVRDAYSVFGLKNDCSDDDVKRNYKRLAGLVSPDKCNIDAVDDVFELVNVAFAAIGQKDLRAEYTAENAKHSEAHAKVISVWNKMAKAVECARNTIFCDCDETHYRIATAISPAQARTCKRCGIKHPAKQNDIWVEKKLFGFASTYYTCTDNVVYDITSWATCKSQRAMLKNMRAHTHHVQYRLLSPLNTDCDTSSQYFNSSINYPSSTDARFLSDLQEEYSTLLRQRSLAQISFKNCEPREEDRSRRAANRRQKRWR